MAQGGFSSDRPRALVTFAEFWDGHFTPNLVTNLKPATQQLYRILGKTHLIPCFGNGLLVEITRLDIQRFINAKRTAGYSVQTLVHFRNLLSKIFGCAVKWGFLPTNPATEIELPPMVRKRKPRILTPEEISVLALELREPARTIFLAGALLGLRIGELLALQAGDIDLLAAQIHIRRDVYRGKVGTPKTQAGERTLPIPEALLPALAFHCQGKRPEEWLFPNAAGLPFDDRNLIRREVRPVCARLGIPRFTWHSLRHTFSTYGGNNGVAMPVLQSLLGHTSANVTMKYTHPLAASQREAIEQLALKLWPTVAQSKPDSEGISNAVN